MKPKRFGFPDAGEPAEVRDPSITGDAPDDCNEIGPIPYDDPAVEAAVEGIVAELAKPGYDIPAANEPTWAERRRIRAAERTKAFAAVYRDARRMGLDADSRDVREALATVRNILASVAAADSGGPLFAPVWNREPSSDLDAAGVAVSGATVVGALCLVALVVFFIGAVIWGRL